MGSNGQYAVVTCDLMKRSLWRVTGPSGGGAWCSWCRNNFRIKKNFVYFVTGYETTVWNHVRNNEVKSLFHSTCLDTFLPSSLFKLFGCRMFVSKFCVTHFRHWHLKSIEIVVTRLYSDCIGLNVDTIQIKSMPNSR